MDVPSNPTGNICIRVCRRVAVREGSTLKLLVKNQVGPNFVRDINGESLHLGVLFRSMGADALVGDNLGCGGSPSAEGAGGEASPRKN